jgi:hypothetical protein
VRTQNLIVDQSHNSCLFVAWKEKENTYRDTMSQDGNQYDDDIKQMHALFDTVEINLNNSKIKFKSRTEIEVVYKYFAVRDFLFLN